MENIVEKIFTKTTIRLTFNDTILITGEKYDS